MRKRNFPEIILKHSLKLKTNKHIAMYYEKNNDRIEYYKALLDSDILSYLCNFWQISSSKINDGIFQLIATYEESTDKNGYPCGYFVDVRNLNGDKLYYPFKLGLLNIYTRANDNFKSQEFWLINVQLENIKHRTKNPFKIKLANTIVGKPKLTFTERLRKENIIRKIFRDTGSSERDAKNTSHALVSIMGDLYTETERFIFELIQNADDQPQIGHKVSVNLKTLREHLIFMHSGQPFTDDDVESISSIGDSTKRKDNGKIGYKGIGFKSVFSDADTVYINSGQYSFAFDKQSPLYHDIENVNEIPWQIKPIWEEKYRLPKEIQEEDRFFSSPVSIGLEVGEDKIKEYNTTLSTLFSEPRFLIFLRNIGTLRFESSDGRSISIFKESKENVITLNTNGESTEWILSDYIEDIPSEISDAIQGDRLIPAKLKEAKQTKISFAVKVYGGKITPINHSTIFTYLPTKEGRYNFPFIANADFLTTASRESIHERSLWNRYLLVSIAGRILDLVVKLKDYPDYLSALPSDYLTNQLPFASDFNEVYKHELESKSFILNQKGTLSKQSEIIVDDSGLINIIGENALGQLVGTEKLFPAKSISLDVFSNKIYQDIEHVRIDKICQCFDNNEVLSDWYLSAAEEQRQQLCLWINDNICTCSGIIPQLPLFKFEDELLPIDEINNRNQGDVAYIITDSRFDTIRDVLGKMSVLCSENTIESFLFATNIPKQEDKDIYNNICKHSFNALTTKEKLELIQFFYCLDGVGEETIGKLNIFSNVNGEKRPLNGMLPFIENAESWRSKFILCKDEYTKELDNFLVKPEDEFIKLIWPNVQTIDAEPITLWNKYRWTDEKYTLELIDECHDNDEFEKLLVIVENSSDRVKSALLDKIKEIQLSKGMKYSNNSFESRVIRLALDVLQKPSIFSSKINYEGVKLSSFSFKDDVTCEFLDTKANKNRSVKFSIEKLLPSTSSNTSLISLFKTNFEKISKKELDRFFDVKEKSLRTIANELQSSLSLKPGLWPSQCGNAYQYLFYVYYYRKVMNYTSTWVLKINLENETDSFVKDLFDFLFTNNIDIETSPFTYRISIKGKYMSNEYVLHDEMILPSMEKWADTIEKINYLAANGVNKADSPTVLLRKSFIDGSYFEHVKQIPESNLKASLSYMVKARNNMLPFVGKNQRSMLLEMREAFPRLFDINIDEGTLEKESVELDNLDYENWSTDTSVKIYIYNGMMPCFIGYEKFEMLCINEENYYYSSSNKKLYVNKECNLSDILFEVAKNGKTSFCLDDYCSLFVNGKISISRELIEEKDKEISKLQAEKEDIESILKRYRQKYGDIDNLYSDVKPYNTRIKSISEVDTDRNLLRDEWENSIISLLGDGFQLPEDDVKCENLITRWRVYNYVKNNSKYTIANSFNDEQLRAYIEGETTVIPIDDNRKLIAQGAKGGIWYISPNVWRGLDKNEAVVCICTGNADGDFCFAETLDDIENYANTKNVLIKVAPRNEHTMMDSISSIFPGDDNYQMNIHLMVRVHNTKNVLDNIFDKAFDGPVDDFNF